MEVSAELYKGGRITIPVQIRNLFNMHGGDQLTFRVENNAITVLTEAQLWGGSTAGNTFSLAS